MSDAGPKSKMTVEEMYEIALAAIEERDARITELEEFLRESMRDHWAGDGDGFDYNGAKGLLHGWMPEDVGLVERPSDKRATAQRLEALGYENHKHGDVEIELARTPDTGSEGPA